MRKTILLAAAATAAFTAIPASAATIVFEDFESAPYQFTMIGNVGVANGNTYQACCNTTGSAAAMANNFAAFGGGNNPSGIIFAAVKTIIGQTYTINFDFGALSGTNGSLDPLTLSVNGTSVRYSRPSDNNLDNTFANQSYSFVATSTSTDFGFQSQGIDNVDAVLDNVRFSGAVPEPATWALMILGFGAVGGAMRRRKAQVAFA